MDRGYVYVDRPRSPVRVIQPARSSHGSSSGREYYEPSYYEGSRYNSDRLSTGRGSALSRPVEDYDAPHRRVYLAPHDSPKIRRHSMNPPTDRRPLQIIPPASNDRLRPTIQSATIDRRPSDARGSYYSQPASPRTGHGRHLSAEVDPRGRLLPPTSRSERPPSQHYDSAKHYAVDHRRFDDRVDRRVIEGPPTPISRRHFYHDQALRPRAGSDVGSRGGRDNLPSEYVRVRPREGGLSNSQSIAKMDRSDRVPVVRHEYRSARDDSHSTSSGSTTYRGDHDRRRPGHQPIAIHQDYEYGYSSSEDTRRDRDKPRQQARPGNEYYDRRYDSRYDSDSDSRRVRSDRHREKPTHRERAHDRDDSDDKYSSRKQDKAEVVDHRSRRGDDDRRAHKSHRDEEWDETDRRHKRHDDFRDDVKEHRNVDRREDRQSDEDKGRKSDRNDRSKHIAEALGLGGAGTALVGLARSALKKKAGQHGNDSPSDEEREYERDHDRRGRSDDGAHRRRRGETEEERRARHRRRREQETEEETKERRRRRRERHEARDRGISDRNGDRPSDKDYEEDREGERRKKRERGNGSERDRDRPSSDDSKDKDKKHSSLDAGLAGAALGAGIGAVSEHRSKKRNNENGDDKDRERSRESRQDHSRRRRGHHRHDSESEMSESSSSETEDETPRPPAMRPRALSAARPAPAKGILKTPTQQFPERPSAMREGVAPLKDAKGHEGIPPEARWTRISRRLINPDALREAQERFEERPDAVIVLRVLSHDEIEKFARRTQELRSERRKQDTHALDVEERERREQEQMDQEDKPLAIDRYAYNAEPDVESAVQNATERRNSPPQAEAIPVNGHKEPAAAAAAANTWSEQERHMEVPTSPREQEHEPASPVPIIRTSPAPDAGA